MSVTNCHLAPSLRNTKQEIITVELQQRKAKEAADLLYTAAQKSHKQPLWLIPDSLL